MRKILVPLLGLALALLAPMVATAHADSKLIRPRQSWNVGAVQIESLHAGGVKLRRACNATLSVCRYYKLRPYSACSAICPLVAAWQTWTGGINGRILVPRSARWPVRVKFHRLPHCGCEA
jgi:hypothetical protein